jgi:hypothetical protein
MWWLVLVAGGLEVAEPYGRIGGALEGDVRIAPHVSFDLLFRARHYDTEPDECTEEYQGMEYDLAGGLRGDLFDLTAARRVFPFLAFDAGARWITQQSVCAHSQPGPTLAYPNLALTLGLDLLPLGRSLGLRLLLRGSEIFGTDGGRTVDGGGALMVVARF